MRKTCCIFNCFLTLASVNGVLGTDKEGMQKQNGNFTLTSSNGSDKQHRQNQKGILTWTSLNGLLGSD